MATVSAATYDFNQGIIYPAIKPTRPPREVVVVYVNEVSSQQSSYPPIPPVTPELKAAFQKTRGILPPDHPDGVTFENTLRKEAEDRLRQLDW